MLKLFIILSLLIPAFVSAQDSTAIRHEIDSILSIKIKVKRHGVKSDWDSVHYTVAFHKATGNLMSIDEIHYPVLGGKTEWWIYRYHFRNDALVLISKYNNVKMKDPRWQNAYYYFRNKSLAYREEKGTSIPDIDAEFKKGISLRDKFSN